MTVTYGDQTLLETSTFIVPGLGMTKVVLGGGTESLTFLLNFETIADKPLNLHSKPVDNRTLSLTFTNWDNVLGTGLLQALQVGSFNNRKLYLLIFVRKIGGKGDQKLVTLSFYTGEEVPSGQN
jgi:hypothetical protein